eukprot:gene30884-35932_t
MSIFISIPAMLWMIGLASQGWTWVHVALFSSIVAVTDAVAVAAILKSCGAPEELGALLEGESLFNDASGIVFFVAVAASLKSCGAPEELGALLEGESLFNDTSGIVFFEIFFRKLKEMQDTGDLLESNNSVWHEIVHVGQEFMWLAGGGLVVGLIFGYATT